MFIQHGSYYAVEISEDVTDRIEISDIEKSIAEGWCF